LQADRRKDWRGALTRVGLALAVVLAFVHPAAAQDRLKLAVGQRGFWDTSAAEMGQRAGIFRKHGLVLEILYTEGSGETLQAVLSRAVDAGVGLGVMGTLGAFSKGAPIRVIGGQATGMGDHFWYVRADSPIRTLADTAGRTIAYSTNGSSTNGVVLAFVDQHRLTARPTATGGPAATLTLVMSGQVDVGWAAPPFGLDQLDRRQIRIIATGNDAAAFRGQTVRVLGSHAQVLGARREALERFVQAYRETISWMFASDEVIPLYAEFAGISEAMAERTRGFFSREGLDPNRVTGLDLVMDDAVRLNYVDAPLSPAQLRQLIQLPARP
jgi:NitT/TauT family transport system substrate-binding protein